jgi:hypothetical protein
MLHEHSEHQNKNDINEKVLQIIIFKRLCHANETNFEYVLKKIMCTYITHSNKKQAHKK